MARSSYRTIDLRDLNACAAVARRRSFRGAAHELGVSVSTLSVRLRDLATLLGVRPLNREKTATPSSCCYSRPLSSLDSMRSLLPWLRQSLTR